MSEKLSTSEEPSEFQKTKGLWEQTAALPALQIDSVAERYTKMFSKILAGMSIDDQANCWMQLPEMFKKKMMPDGQPWNI